MFEQLDLCEIIGCEQYKMAITTSHNHILYTLTTCNNYQNNHVESTATSWP